MQLPIYNYIGVNEINIHIQMMNSQSCWLYYIVFILLSNLHNITFSIR